MVQQGSPEPVEGLTSNLYFFLLQTFVSFLYHSTFQNKRCHPRERGDPTIVAIFTAHGSPRSRG